MGQVFLTVSIFCATLASMKTQADLLAALRERRNFKVDDYIEKKVAAINQFFKDEFLDAAVVGLSGGVDSSVVYKLLLEAKKAPDSPIKRVLGVVCPVDVGTTNQDKAGAAALELVHQAHNGKATKADFVTIDGTRAALTIIDQSSCDDSWVHGQLASIVRTPVFYYQVAALQTQGHRSILVGTTNRSEGSYIGFFGKASDAAVDLQPIADIFKSEVLQVARALGVPESIISRPPTGDVYDGKNSEQLMGFSYDDLEAFLILMDIGGEERIQTYEYLFKSFPKIREWNSKNKHKYIGGQGFARYIDIMPRAIKGGWRDVEETR